jgi:hypothetical protein
MFADFQDTAIAALDLDPIKVKLIHPESGEGWTRQHTDAVELEYRRFLFLMKKFPNEVTAPLADVDTFWHYHILDTMKYAADCEHMFGYFLHHFPYSGMRGEEDLAAHAAAGNRMQELYEQTFGVAQFAGTQGAYCLQPAGSAYCLRAAESAYCLRTPSKSGKRTTTKPVYGVIADAPRQSAGAASAYCLMPPAQMNRSTLERPRLASAAA